MSKQKVWRGRVLAASGPCTRADNFGRVSSWCVLANRYTVHACTRLHTQLLTASYKSDSQDGIAQTSRHDTALGPKLLSRWLACAICAVVAA